MEITIRAIHNALGKSATLKGWVYNIRSSGKITFLQLRDGTGEMQVIAEKSTLSEKIWKNIHNVTIESAVIVQGKVTKHPKHEQYELQLSDIEIIHAAQEYPIGKKEHGPDFLLDHRHLWIRSPRQAAILRLRSEIIFILHEFYQKEGFYLTHTPTFTPNACEGTTDLFSVKYFDTKVYLSQNGQLYLEALAMALGKVYDMNPNFRAEKSKTRRHLTEFWTINPEIAFCTLDEALKLQERTIQYVCREILRRARPELKILERDTKVLETSAEATYPRMTHREAVQLLQSLGRKIGDKDDLGADDEALLMQQFETPLFVTHYPREIKPFYMERDPKDSSVVLNNDMLAPEGCGEIIGGGQRLVDYKALRENIQKAGLKLADFEWYLDLRRYGSVPHYGYGIGIERLVRWIAGIHHVRETIPFPRMLNRVTP
ncbi:MAG: asparagine--tRNA ligase [Candidatus Kerfeldbacteria bacterium RIFCSPLOWO2_02_FULL_42_19]|nr:MAG: asparagine--tRNA ligase [Candidatus Kerfeldbacteria bacterium RIFCSPHIGHO2_12_FULL_42_13]OGY83915.1 MAG: asparagine--tRNA ligase [Candidatus Kerfeldbacteria bacterium RIFCSPLOWO2_02_FULL_42_19]OGY85412.1 MAG: asparagine--tRNA ligase [Candidatus Kerfeldbacteria bacterium RIFCSPLOWO2_12_FULL_43_9]